MDDQKNYRRGTHRTQTPEQTLARVQNLFGPLGITRVANITGLDHVGIPVVMVTRPMGRSLSVTQGKGLDLISAKVSGVMEAIELEHAENIALTLMLASQNRIAFTHRLAEIHRLPRCGMTPFHPELRMHWIEGHTLRGGSSRWLPYQMVHTDYRRPLPLGSGAFIMSSSGLASGNTFTEAVSHGLAELIERDATTLWNVTGEEAQAQTRIRPETIDDEDAQLLLAQFARADLKVIVWETTSDVGLSCFKATIADSDPGFGIPVRPMSGMGCHPSRSVALSRALTEAAQSRLTLICGAREDVPHRSGVERALQWFEGRYAQPPQRSFQDVPSEENSTVTEDLALMQNRLDAVDITEVLIVDLTRPEFKIPVVRVVAPGLEALNDVAGWLPGLRAHRIAQR